jgi:hypothetical protein
LLKLDNCKESDAINHSPIKQYSMNWRDVLSILFGLKKPALVPIPKTPPQAKK